MADIVVADGYVQTRGRIIVNLAPSAAGCEMYYSDPRRLQTEEDKVLPTDVQTKFALKKNEAPKKVCKRSSAACRNDE